MNTEKTKKPLSKRHKIALAVILLCFLLLGAELVRSNTLIDVENFEYKSASIPESFDGVKIVLLTDYHNHGGSYEDRLIETVKEQSPDYIFLGGDMADRKRTDLPCAERFMRKCAEIAPCYFVYGNHELALQNEPGLFEKFCDCADAAGVNVLNNTIIELERDGDSIYLGGTTTTTGILSLEEQLAALDDTKQLLWLHHYPEDFEQYAATLSERGFDDMVMFCGHAHGGLIEIPFTKIGAFAPGQGFLPKYTSGEYHSGGCEMLLSRGCGNSGYTLRLFDEFHVVVCTLRVG